MRLIDKLKAMQACENSLVFVRKNQRKGQPWLWKNAPKSFKCWLAVELNIVGPCFCNGEGARAPRFKTVQAALRAYKAPSEVDP